MSAAPLAVVVTSADPLGVGDDVWLGPLTAAQLAIVVGEDRAAVVDAIWSASRGRPGPAKNLAGVVRTLDSDRDPVVGLALSVTSGEGFLELDAGLIRLLETALARSADDRSRALLLARLAHALLGEAAVAERRRELVDEALRLARRESDPAILAEVLDARLHALWDSVGAYDRLDSASEIIQLARESADPDRERRGLFWRFVALMELARVDDAESALAAFTAEARAAGDRQDELMAIARHAMLATLRGNFEEALRLTGRVEVEGRQSAVPLSVRGPGTDRARVAAYRSRAAELARGLAMVGLEASLSSTTTDHWQLRRDDDDWELQAGERARPPAGQPWRALSAGPAGRTGTGDPLLRPGGRRCGRRLD